MKDEQEDHKDSHSESVEGTKRKMEENIQLAKQKAQEIAARLVGNAESKRPRLDDSSELAPLSSSASNPSFPGIFNFISKVSRVLDFYFYFLPCLYFIYLSIFIPEMLFENI